jgi:multidrug efflux pump
VFSGMLGVTLFGIILTPVFFYVIDYLGETGPFASPGVRRVGAGAVGLLTLAPVWSATRRLWHRTTARPTRPQPPAPVEQQ